MGECVVLFVEGDTDKVLFENIIAYYKSKSGSKVKCYVENLKGVSKYTSQVKGKLQKYYLPKVRNENLTLKCVLCSYDTDVFEFAAKPVVNWKKMKKEMEGIVGKGKVELIPVVSSIEDWLLTDMVGLCSFLGLHEVPKRLNGQTGFSKISDLFRKTAKVYSKGYECKKLVSSLNIECIVETHKEALKPLKKVLG